MAGGGLKAPKPGFQAKSASSPCAACASSSFFNSKTDSVVCLWACLQDLAAHRFARPHRAPSVRRRSTAVHTWEKAQGVGAVGLWGCGAVGLWDSPVHLPPRAHAAACKRKGLPACLTGCPIWYLYAHKPHTKQAVRQAGKQAWKPAQQRQGAARAGAGGGVEGACQTAPRSRTYSFWRCMKLSKLPSAKRNHSTWSRWKLR